MNNEKIRLSALEIFKSHEEKLEKFNMHGAIWFSVSSEFGLDHGEAFFSNYFDAENWINQKFEFKKRYCSEFYSYINGYSVKEYY